MVKETENIIISAFLFNPETLEKSIVETENRLKPIYNLLDCRLVEVIRIDDRIDVIVDEEGTFAYDENPYVTVLTYKNESHVICGKFLIVRSDFEGNWISFTPEIEENISIRMVSRTRYDSGSTYTLQVTDSNENNVLVRAYNFDLKEPLPIIEKMNTRNFTSKGRYVFTLKYNTDNASAPMLLDPFYSDNIDEVISIKK